MKPQQTIKTVFLLIPALIIIGCYQNKTKESKKEGRNHQGIYDCEIIKEHIFSSQDKLDTFKLVYSCNNPEDSMIFQIVNYSGAVIYEKLISGAAFYDYGRPWYKYVTDPKRGKDFSPEKLSTEIADSLHEADIQYMKQRMKGFFSDEKFMLNPMKKLNTKLLNMSDYSTVLNDSTVVGFSYNLFTGGGFEMIAYSKKLNKVTLIASSD